jgi:hypothetical protein
MSLSEHQDQISADKLSNNMEVIPPMSLTYATAVVLSERIPICNDFCHLPKYVSWSFDPHAIFTDTFTISWSEFKPYIFPPFSLIGKVMLKIMSDKVEKAILIVPFWPAQN